MVLQSILNTFPEWALQRYSLLKFCLDLAYKYIFSSVVGFHQSGGIILQKITYHQRQFTSFIGGQDLNVFQMILNLNSCFFSMIKCLYIYTVRIQREYGAISVLPEHKHVSNVLGATESWQCGGLHFKSNTFDYNQKKK